MLHKTKYSEKELKMFKELECGDLMDVMSVFQLYNIAMEKCFVNDWEGKAVESLRRCMKTFKKCEIYRMTKEWDDLIQL